MYSKDKLSIFHLVNCSAFFLLVWCSFLELHILFQPLNFALLDYITGNCNFTQRGKKNFNLCYKMTSVNIYYTHVSFFQFEKNSFV